jgi:hypothetical protein
VNSRNIDFYNFIYNKRVAFVCPSRILEESWSGDKIDKFDIVVRTNTFFPVTDKIIARDYGKKCDILYINTKMQKEFPVLPIERYVENGLKWLCFKTDLGKDKELYNNSLNIRDIQHLLNKKQETYVKSPLMGTLIILDILDHFPKEFWIFGMNFYNGNILDFENQYLPNYLPENVYKDYIDKRQNGFFTKDKIHDTEENRRFVMNLYHKGKIKFDTITKTNLGLA